MVDNREDVFRVLDSLKDMLKDLGVKRIGLFGSFARDENSPDSDVDLLVSFIPGYKNFINFFQLAEILEEHFGRKVEMLTEEGLSPYLREEIEKEIGYYEVAA